MKFKFRHADKIVGAFILLALLFICFMLIMVGKNKRWFQEDTGYRTQFLTATGLSDGMKIKFRGFNIGEITDFDLNNENLVDAQFIIYEDYLNKIRPGSVLEMNNSPLGGGLNFYPGIEPGSPPRAGEYIPSTHFPEGKRLVDEGLVDIPDQKDIVSELLKSVPNLMEDVDKTVITVNNLLDTVNRSLQGDPEAGPIPDILYGVTAIENEIGLILKDVNRMTDSIATLLSEMENPDNLLPRLVGKEGVAGAVFSDESELYQSIFLMLDEISVSLENVSKLTGSLSELSPQIALLLKETTSTLNEAEDVLEGLKNNPLLRGGVTQEEDPSAPVGTEIRDNEF